MCAKLSEIKEYLDFKLEDKLEDKLGVFEGGRSKKNQNPRYLKDLVHNFKSLRNPKSIRNIWWFRP